MEESTLLMIRLGLIFGLIFIFMIMLFIMRASNMKKVIGRTYCEVITAEGKSYKRLWEVQSNGLVIVPPIKDKRGMIFKIDTDSCYDSTYPELPGFMSFICAPVKKVTLDEHSLFPLSNRGKTVTLTPEEFYAILNEGFSYIGVEVSQAEIAEINDTYKHIKPQGKKSSGFSLKWVLGIVIVGVIVGVVFFIVKILPTYNAAIGA